MQLAQNVILPGISGTPSVTLKGPLDDRFDSLGSLVSALLPYVYTTAGLLLFLYLLWGGYDILFAAGDPQKMSAGRTKIINAIIGFVIVFVAFFLTQLSSFIFSFDFF